MNTAKDNAGYVGRTGSLVKWREEWKIVSRDRLPSGLGVTLEFTDGGRRTVTIGEFVRGWVRNPMRKSVYGVGYLGEPGLMKRHPRAYALWANMLSRCYCEARGETSYTGVEVEERWHCLRNFIEDLPDLPGYEAWESGQRCHFDKDGRAPSARIYSRATCQFLPPAENIRLGATAGKEVICAETGKRFPSIAAAARELQIPYSRLYRAVRNMKGNIKYDQ